MLLSTERQFIFIHVYKTGGTSISTALARYGRNPSRTLLRRCVAKAGLHPPEAVFPYRYRKFYKHIRARVLKSALPSAVYDNYFKFAFVRNPWDVQVSMYHYIMSDPNHVFHSDVMKLGGFESFIEWIIEHYHRLQKDFIVDEHGRQIVDFVGRFEHMQTDFRRTCEVIGVTAELPHRNASSHNSFRSYYTPRARRLVEEHYREDIELFGYTFDEVAELHA